MPGLTDIKARIGRTDVEVTRLGFGAAAMAGLYRAVPEERARASVHAAYDAGVRYFDTAPHYGFGLSETRLGAALKALDPHEHTVVSTKVGRLLVPVDADPTEGRHGFVGAAPFEPVFDYSYDAVMRSFEDSRRRLRRERIDILLAHDLGLSPDNVRQIVSRVGRRLRELLADDDRYRLLGESGWLAA